MRETPTVPEWMRAYRTPSYTNIYELCPAETRVYGTESLFGDWDGELLLLAKDFAPVGIVRENLARGDERPYHHQDWIQSPLKMGAKTNRQLHEMACRIDCGKLYGSALAGLLRNDNRVSGPLPDLAGVMPFVGRVLRFVVNEMPNLRGIACLGQDAWCCAAIALRSDQTEARSLTARRNEWRLHRRERRPKQVGETLLFALAHTSRYSGGKERVIEDWGAMRRWLGLPPTETAS